MAAKVRKGAVTSSFRLRSEADNTRSLPNALNKEIVGDLSHIARCRSALGAGSVEIGGCDVMSKRAVHLQTAHLTSPYQSPSSVPNNGDPHRNPNDKQPVAVRPVCCANLVTDTCLFYLNEKFILPCASAGLAATVGRK
ncbi:hypothetical protein Bbelb_067640 [Branchiostoma belcheri]|nr:hypothetical protein Bbelb_067640 [Branchiostoma belcheri]